MILRFTNWFEVETLCFYMDLFEFDSCHFRTFFSPYVGSGEPLGLLVLTRGTVGLKASQGLMF